MFTNTVPQLCGEQNKLMYEYVLSYRTAVLLWGKDMFTNTVSQLCGEQQLKQRHLEMLGYRVIGISNSLWNSMYMSEIETKIRYLREKLGMTIHNM